MSEDGARQRPRCRVIRELCYETGIRSNVALESVVRVPNAHLSWTWTSCIQTRLFCTGIEDRVAIQFTAIHNSECNRQSDALWSRGTGTLRGAIEQPR